MLTPDEEQFIFSRPVDYPGIKAAFCNSRVRCAVCGTTREGFELYAGIVMHDATTVCCSDDWEIANADLLRLVK